MAIVASIERVNKPPDANDRRLLGLPGPCSAMLRCFNPMLSTDSLQMLRRLACLACLLLISAAQAAVSSPRDDADYIASYFVRNDGYRLKLHEMITKARVNGLIRYLSGHSVKVRDHERLTELMSDFGIPEVVFDEIQRIAADALTKRMGPGELASLADHVRNLAIDPDARRAGARARDATTVMTIDEFKELPEELARLTESQSFKNEIALTSVMVSTIFLAAQATAVMNIDPKPSEIADALVVDGVFFFPNGIARRNLIRELRAASP
jgi:hypothetical protein